MTPRRYVLIVEDDNWLAESYSLILTQAGWTARTVHSAKKALEAIDEKIPDVVLLDVLLPGANAVELMHELQSYSDTKNLPIVLCTTLTHQHLNRDNLEKYGVRAVLNKARLTPQHLLNALQQAIKNE